MGLLDLASNNSYWRGLSYFKDNRVKNIVQTNRYEYDADVQGTELYHVHINIDHPRKSTCTCPHASGKTTICKHKVAVYFAIDPDAVEEAEDIINRYEKERDEIEERFDEQYKKRIKMIEDYVTSLDEETVRKMLTNMLCDEAYDEVARETGYDEFDDDYY